MKRRALLTALFAASGAVAVAASPAEARRRRYRGISHYRRRRSHVASRSSYRPVSSQTTAEVEQPWTKSRQQFVDSQTRVARSVPYDGAQRYGVEGTITNSEANTLKHLDYSKGQSYQAIKSRIGFPAYRNGNTDYYDVNGGWVVIDYKDGKAYGHTQQLR